MDVCHRKQVEEGRTGVYANDDVSLSCSAFYASSFVTNAHKVIYLLNRQHGSITYHMRAQIHHIVHLKKVNKDS
jgi:hypothetical protein